jgi:hypothetical protein
MEPEFSPYEAALQRAAPALSSADVPFLLAGSLASWVRGGPETDHDLDLMVRPSDADRALEALAACGMRTERPPMDWLYKAWDGETLLDLIFRPSGLDVDDELFRRSEQIAVAGITVDVISVEDLLLTKLMSLSPNRVDFTPTLQIARSIREQVDWSEVRARTARSPYARAFFALLRELEIIESPDAERAAQVRVVAGAV